MGRVCHVAVRLGYVDAVPASRAESVDALIESLTPRRREILEYVAKGLTNDEIARLLAISPLTVRTHITGLLAQLQVANRTEATAAYVAWQARPARMANIVGRPAIAVLPFTTLGTEPRAQALGVGLAHDLGALFARWCWFPVIASTSTAIARTLGRTCVEIGHALGARFLVDGDLRAARGAWRLSVRIDDAETGHALWSDHFDFPREALFDVQDSVCEAIVAAAYPVLAAHAHPRAPSHNALDAWWLAHEAMALYAGRERSTSAQALAHFTQALHRDTDLVLAHFGVGLVSYDELLNQWGPADEAAARLTQAAERCVALAPFAAEGYFLRARAAMAAGGHVRAIEPLEVAIANNPSFAAAHALLAQTLAIAGRDEEALVRMHHAVRLGPRSFVAGLAALHFILGRYEEALRTAERAIVTNPYYGFARVVAVAAAYWGGQHESALRHRRALASQQPAFDPAQLLATFGAKVDVVERFAAALVALA